MDDDAYDSVQRGGLSLKKKMLKTANKIKKKKKKKSKKSKPTKEDLEEKDEITVEELRALDDNGNRRDKRFAHMTDNEYKYELERLKREKEQMKKKAKRTHRERVDEFNAALAALPTHFDLPKVAMTSG